MGDAPRPELLRTHLPGKECNLVQGAQAGLGEASWLILFSLLETQSLGGFW